MAVSHRAKGQRKTKAGEILAIEKLRIGQKNTFVDKISSSGRSTWTVFELINSNLSWCQWYFCNTSVGVES
jgi:hypothetical protein